MPAIAKKGILYTETPSVENRVVEGNQNPVTSGAVYNLTKALLLLLAYKQT